MTANEALAAAVADEEHVMKLVAMIRVATNVEEVEDVLKQIARIVRYSLFNRSLSHLYFFFNH